MISNVDQARAAVARISMPRGPFPVAFEVRDLDEYGPGRGGDLVDLILTIKVPDRDTGDRKQVAMRGRLVLPCSDRDLTGQVLATVIRLFEHEAREAFLVDGVRVYDPHEPHEYERGDGR